MLRKVTPPEPLVRAFVRATCKPEKRTHVAAGHATVSRRDAVASFTLGPGLMIPPWASARPKSSTSAVSDAEQVLVDPKWPEEWPFRDELFNRFDEAKDDSFYSAPRYVTHIDDAAIRSIQSYYDSQFPKAAADREGFAVLDMCSSWISHYPEGFSAGRVAGLGMNEAELKRNKVLTEFDVKDLNDDPKLPYDDASFDMITNAVSVDYLTKPLEIFREMHRVLKPGGKAIMSFSNRCFPTKAIAVWTSTGDLDHIWIVGAYFHYSVPGGYVDIRGKDITSAKSAKGRGDPMYVVEACKA